VALVFVAGSSSRLAAAYGVAVTSTMVVTTLLLSVVARERWRWPLAAVLAFSVFFLIVDLSFWIANLIKIPAGGWFPLAVGVVVITIMTTWKRGRQILRERMQAGGLPLDALAGQLHRSEVVRVPGTAVYLYSDPEGTPPALLNNLRHNKVLHDQVVLLTIKSNEIPYVPRAERLELHKLENGFFRIILCYGFMEDPEVPRDLALAQEAGLHLDLDQVSYILGREQLLATKRPGMARWRETLFAIMSRNARDAADFFHLPTEQVVGVGVRVEL
jgi:KUP system potassium uptake protein